MFTVGQKIIYGNSGVCLVEKVGTMEGMGDRQYYTLKPLFIKDSTIFAPVDTDKVVMRPIVTKEEIDQIIADIPKLEQLWIADEKTREQNYKEALATADPRELIRIIKTIFPRKVQRIAQGKKVTASDERNFLAAEEALYREISVVLDKDIDAVQQMFIEEFEKLRDTLEV